MVEIPAEEFASHDASSGVDGLTFEVGRVLTHGEDRVMPFV